MNKGTVPQSDPPAGESRHNRAKRFLRRFWVAGTAGAFLSALSRSIPLDIEGKWPKLPHADLLVRYMYMCWLLIYFSISSFNTEEDERHLWKDVSYDVFQSILALGAVFCLGFAVRGEPSNWLIAYRFTNLAILLMSGLSLILFHADTTPRLNLLRWCTAIVSGLAIGFTFVIEYLAGVPPVAVFATFFVMQLVLLLILGRFVYIRWNVGSRY